MFVKSLSEASLNYKYCPKARSDYSGSAVTSNNCSALAECVLMNNWKKSFTYNALQLLLVTAESLQSERAFAQVQKACLNFTAILGFKLYDHFDSRARHEDPIQPGAVPWRSWLHPVERRDEDGRQVAGRSAGGVPEKGIFIKASLKTVSLGEEDMYSLPLVRGML